MASMAIYHPTTLPLKTHALRDRKRKRHDVKDMSSDIAAQWKLLQSIKQYNQHLRRLLNESPAIELTTLQGIVFQYPIMQAEPFDAETTKQILAWYFSQDDDDYDNNDHPSLLPI
ncbi:hypothetical protein LEN26_018392 [Aphanomyces euteiches]|nr:hypothetical protein LEN26_018392 [Aphanomyces euteiches]KAH9116104.1 hypothetical protein AeMF1_009909 [Aphanomyces euteiches]KAH9193963.1 hypothetical protein AeNC1_004061 [Aphanomyces euteiches]